MNEQTFTLSNPRKEDIIENWPLGSSRCGTATFTHEKNNRGERISRVTPNKHGQPCKPKRSTYAVSIRLVDGSDGKTHLLSFSSGFVQISSCDMQHSDFSVFDGDDNFESYKAMAFAE